MGDEIASGEDVIPLIEVADSKFFGYARRVTNKSEAIAFQESLKKKYPDAAHVPMAFIIRSGNYQEDGFDEDSEPIDSTGPGLVEAIKESLKLSKSKDTGTGTAVVVVRFFGSKLLGVTCGRLPQCYKAISKLALHRFFNNIEPLENEYLQVDKSMYGLAAGDTELILNIVSDSDAEGKPLFDTVTSELEFGGFKGSVGEVLPRLQNLQASISDGVIPVYRYPGNYNGDEWETFEWSPTSLKITESVERSLLPLVEQKMNHCVANYYRNGKDFIAHHSDKDLDLNREGVIVSVSLGDSRILELKRRAEPRDVTRVILPHCSMLVLGPKTNKLFTHSILTKGESTIPRISLTIRDVKTFLDVKTGRLYGQGTVAKSANEIRKTSLVENSIFFLGFCALTGFISLRKSTGSKSMTDIQTGLVITGAYTAASLAFRLVSRMKRKEREETAARQFFSKASTSGTKY